jgi:hypothetical protein
LLPLDQPDSALENRLYFLGVELPNSLFTKLTAYFLPKIQCIIQETSFAGNKNCACVNISKRGDTNLQRREKSFHQQIHLVRSEQDKYAF